MRSLSEMILPTVVVISAQRAGLPADENARRHAELGNDLAALDRSLLAGDIDGPFLAYIDGVGSDGMNEEKVYIVVLQPGAPVLPLRVLSQKYDQDYILVRDSEGVYKVDSATGEHTGVGARFVGFDRKPDSGGYTFNGQMYYVVR